MSYYMVILNVYCSAMKRSHALQKFVFLYLEVPYSQINTCFGVQSTGLFCSNHLPVSSHTLFYLCYYNIFSSLAF